MTAGTQDNRARPDNAGRHRVTMLGLAAVLAAGGAGVALAWPDEPADCLAKGPPDIEVTGHQSTPYDGADLAPGTVVDARTAHWTGTDPSVVTLGESEGLCLSGGTVRGEWSPSTSWEVMHGKSAVIATGPRATVEDVRVDGYGDSLVLTVRARNFVVRRVHLSDNRDDCIENDWLHSGTVRDSLLDGCYNAFSARTYDTQEGVHDGSGNLWTIEDSLVRLQPMERVYKDDGLIPGTAGFFKWDAQGPRLSLHGNVFRADQPANTVGLGIPEGKLEECSDNVMVWLGEGDYPEELPSCFTVTTDVRVWDDAVSQWQREHEPRRADRPLEKAPVEPPSPDE